MSRNRMKNSQSLHWMGITKWILIFSLLSGLGLCYMLQKNQNLHLAAERLTVENQLAAIKARNEELRADLEHMKSRSVLERRLAQFHSSLIKWGEPGANWLPWEQHTRAVLARIGTVPKSPMNFDATYQASTVTPVPQPGH
jgi:hypothetical protein